MELVHSLVCLSEVLYVYQNIQPFPLCGSTTLYRYEEGCCNMIAAVRRLALVIHFVLDI